MTNIKKILIGLAILARDRRAFAPVVALLVFSGLIFLLSALYISTAALSRNSDAYAVSSRAFNCSRSAVANLISGSNLPNVIANCEAGQCLNFDADTCGLCGTDVTTVLNCEDISVYPPPVMCEGSIRIGLNGATAEKTIEAIGTCGGTEYTQSYGVDPSGGRCGSSGIGHGNSSNGDCSGGMSLYEL